MLQPKRTKFRKQHKMNPKGCAHKGSTISFGSVALKSITGGRLTARQIESARIAMTRYMKRKGFKTNFSGRNLEHIAFADNILWP